jgi:opine dehydrogenase
MRQAKTIVVTLPDAPQTRLALFNQLQETKLVNDPAKTIVLIRGGQAGQPALSQMIRDNPNWKASVVLVEDSPYGTRVKGLDIAAKRKDSVEISVLGDLGDDTRGLAAMREMFPLGEEISMPSWPDFPVVPGSEMPWRFGYAIHPAVAFDPVNVAKTRAGQVYLHYVEGVHPALGERLGRLDAERVDLAAAYGAESETFPQKLERQFNLTWNRDESFYDTMQRSASFYKSTSYPTVEKLMGSRYPQEDVPGLFTMNWYARKAGLYLPEHALYESDIRGMLGELGMTDEHMAQHLEGYMPTMNRIEGGVPEIIQLLNEPHIRPQ